MQIIPELTCAAEVETCVNRIGFLPLFAGLIPGFSVEEHIDRSRYYFVDGIDGMWEWREQLAASRHVLYGKYLAGSAAFVSREWFPVLANYRRNGYDFDSRAEEGLLAHPAARLCRVLEEKGPLLSVDLRRESGIEKGFDALMTKLQNMTYVSVAEFARRQNREGRPYGWGITRFALTEQLFGELPREDYQEEPTVSFKRLLAHFRQLLPEAEPKRLLRLLG